MEREQAAPDAASGDARSLYIELLKRSVTGLLYEDPSSAKAHKGLFQSALREEGRDWPRDAHTMVGLKRLENFGHAIETVLAEGIAGDVIETGVWRGGACIFAKGVLRAHGADDRKVLLADSFRGLPRPDAKKYPWDRGDKHYQYKELAVSVDAVRGNFERYGLLDDNVVFIEGMFEDTLHAYPFGALSVARLDGDMYGSTITALDALYPKISPGGFLIVDDYGAVPACKAAVTDFREREGIADPIVEIDWTGVYWRKGSADA